MTCSSDIFSGEVDTVVVWKLDRLSPFHGGWSHDPGEVV